MPNCFIPANIFPVSFGNGFLDNALGEINKFSHRHFDTIGISEDQVHNYFNLITFIPSITPALVAL